MFAVRLVQLIETHADKLFDALMHKLKNAQECSELLRNVPAHELKHRTYEIYRHLTDWLVTKTVSEVEERYVGLGWRRARLGVPFSQFLFAIDMTKQVLWDDLLLEGLLEPEDLIGQMELVRSLGQFFDRATYYAAIGYERGQKAEPDRSYSRLEVFAPTVGRARSEQVETAQAGRLLSVKSR
jgi:hypothetical protein